MEPADPGVQAFLAASMVVRVAALSPKGTPFMTPIWFVCDRGLIHLPTGGASLAARYLRVRPAVVLLFDAERGPRSDQVLRIRGTATVRRGRASGRVLWRLLRKYFLCPGGVRSELSHVQQWGVRRRAYALGEGVVIEVRPETADFLSRQG